MPSASADPIPSSTFEGTTSEGSQKGKVSVGYEQIAEGLAKFVEPSSPELMPTAPTPTVQFQSLDPTNAADTSETSPRKKDQKDRVKEIVQSMNAMRVPIPRPPPKELKFQENIHTYLYSAEPEAVFLAPNLHPLIKEDIRRRFEQTALERDEVFSTKDIKTMMRISLHSFANKSIMYAKYLVERKDGKQYTFTDADLKNLCAYDLPQLHAFTEQRLEKRKEYMIANGRIKEVMREHVKYHSKMDFEVVLQLGFEKLSITKPHDQFPRIENVPSNSLITKPEFGFIYRDDDGLKKNVLAKSKSQVFEQYSAEDKEYDSEEEWI
ncbi:hypothetical protein L6452_36274 [Arctium lappa]|uniref:Uncharacterized protein n=1 Tax=Arctium lappa TaxID=4217 RepID=A0ACB8Y8S7_ARCLA|nr:hypothetical protein L6452_36274 [Arctium lappa]